MVAPAFEKELLSSITTPHFKFEEKRYAKIAPKIRQFIKAYLAKQKWQSDGFYYILNSNDDMITKSIHSFNTTKK